MKISTSREERGRVKHVDEFTIRTLLLCFGLIFSQVALSVSDEVAIPRLVELSNLPSPEAVDEVIALASEGSDNEMRQQFAITALIQIGPSTAGDAFIQGLLDDPDSPSISIQGALAYFAERPKSSMEQYAIQFLSDGYGGEIRSQAAYLAGTLGMTSEVARIKSIVTDSSYGDVRLEAAYGLANLVPESEFVSTIDDSDLSDWDKTLAKQLNRFLQSDDVEKNNAVSAMLSESEFILPLAALRHLLETNNEELLRIYVVRGDNDSITIPIELHRLMIRILGYQIDGNIDDINVSVLAPL